MKETVNAPAILIVDDVPRNIQLVAKFLTNEKYNLFFAQSGEAALKQISTRAFDLILLDIMMPGMDGFEVCKEIKKNKATEDIPIVFLTAKSDEEAIAKGFSLGGVDYITKPFNPDELVARVKTHLQLRLREKELLNLNTTKDTLLSIIGHDLRTPFFNIMGLGEMLLNDYDSYDDAMKKELITSIVDSSRASHILLDNLLGWTHIQTGKIINNPENIDMGAVVFNVFDFVASQARNKEVECIYTTDEKVIVCADINMLQTIIRNLVSNAIKFTPHGGKIEVRVKRIEKEVLIEVMDTGIGISPKRLKEIFDAKELKSTPGTDNEPGTGFGLILTKEFVELNKGKIEVESTEGKGTTFRFNLPSGKQNS
jgi:signal transduction histidine kinase